MNVGLSVVTAVAVLSDHLGCVIKINRCNLRLLCA